MSCRFPPAVMTTGELLETPSSSAFGGVEKFKEAGRDVRGLRWLDSLSLDARLGLRMLIKHRGLTLVGGFAMAKVEGVVAKIAVPFCPTLSVAAAAVTSVNVASSARCRGS